MPKFRYTIEFNANSRLDALNRINMSSFVCSVEKNKLSRVCGPRIRKFWQIDRNGMIFDSGKHTKTHAIKKIQQYKKMYPINSDTAHANVFTLAEFRIL